MAFRIGSKGKISEEEAKQIMQILAADQGGGDAGAAAGPEAGGAPADAGVAGAGEAGHSEPDGDETAKSAAALCAELIPGTFKA